VKTTLDDLRRFTVARNFPKPISLQRALARMGFVQADPIRAPARAQDLILRQRLNNYRAGDLEARYATLGIEEDFFVNYGFVTRPVYDLMHPRAESSVLWDDAGHIWTPAQLQQVGSVLSFVQERGAVHPREVDEYFSHGTVTNYWGGSSNATTHLLDAMHYRGLLRIVNRDKGIRIYAARPQIEPIVDEHERRARIDALIDLVVRIYAPLTPSGLNYYVKRLRYAAPQWRDLLPAALQRAKERLAQASIDGVKWFWPVEEKPRRKSPDDRVRLLAPFDPLVHDRGRFELLWNWTYRFEAYTPQPKRKLGYYAMPMLWREWVIGWANISVKDGELRSEFGYALQQPRSREFKRELNAEVERLRDFLGRLE
jgi:uncharacterized protein